MARPQKKGLEYTRLDIDFINDRKIKRLKRLTDASSPLVYIQLVCAILKEGYYLKWDEDLAFDLADTLGMDEDYINGVINACFKVGLLSLDMFQKYLILTSHGIQQQYAFSKAQSKSCHHVEEYSLLVSPEETPVSPEETPVYSEETPDNDEKPESTPEKVHIEKKRILNKMKSSSFYSSSGEESLEQQKQKILSVFFFKNWASPEEEVERFLAFNNTGNRCWSKMDTTQRESALELWKQKPPRPPRFPKDFLEMWEGLYGGLQDLGAPLDVLHDALSDHISQKADRGFLQLRVTEKLKDYIEQPANLERLKKYLWPYMAGHKCEKLRYIIDKR